MFDTAIRRGRSLDIASRLAALLAELEAAPVQRLGAPLRAVAVLAKEYGDLEPEVPDPLGRRRQVATARRLACAAIDYAAYLNGAFGDRPDPAPARRRALTELRGRVETPDRDCGRALGEVAQLTLALPAVSMEDDWQLGAIAFVDERTLRDLYDACLTLATAALHSAASV